MPELLVELFSEEIPARMQARAEQDLARLFRDALSTQGLSVTNLETSSGPRRVALHAEGLPRHSAAVTEERKGPRVGSPEKAVAGFMRSAGLTSLDQCEIIQDPKGDYYVVRMEKPGRTANEIVAGFMPDLIRNFPWAKSMRWGNGRLQWVRPLHSILCIMDGKVVEFLVDGIASGRATQGHRFASGRKSTNINSIEVESYPDYTEKLMHAKVVLTRNQRAEIILKGAQKIATGLGLALVEDHGLLEENAGLVEWPVVLSGRFNEAFLDVPPEILMTAMKSHQKCFSLRHENSGRLANHFILVANIEAGDGGAAIIAGNERVIRARLSDAKFFWDNDRTRPLPAMASQLAQVTFHEKLGTQIERVERIKRLAIEIAPLVGADPAKAGQAAAVCKADLMSGTVGEFPELQGIIGRYIALAQGHDADVATAITDHYKPQGQSDNVPTNPVSIAVALADKLDMLVGFWAIDEKPTGSKDPFALRRAALGVIRIVLENKLRIPLFSGKHWYLAIFNVVFQLQQSKAAQTFSVSEPIIRQMVAELGAAETGKILAQSTDPLHTAVSASATLDDLPKFFIERLKVYLREKGARHDLIDAVFALPGEPDQDGDPRIQDDLLILVRRVKALGAFLETEDGASLLSLVRRTLSILKIEEKKDGSSFDGKPSAKHTKNKEEKALNAAIKSVGKNMEGALKADDFVTAMSALSMLRAPVDTFFETVIVNADDRDIRENRLKLLSGIRTLTLKIADFAKIEG